MVVFVRIIHQNMRCVGLDAADRPRPDVTGVYGAFFSCSLSEDILKYFTARGLVHSPIHEDCCESMGVEDVILYSADGAC